MLLVFKALKELQIVIHLCVIHLYDGIYSQGLTAKFFFFAFLTFSDLIYK